MIQQPCIGSSQRKPFESTSGNGSKESHWNQLEMHLFLLVGGRISANSLSKQTQWVSVGWFSTISFLVKSGGTFHSHVCNWDGHIPLAQPPCVCSDSEIDLSSLNQIPCFGELKQRLRALISSYIKSSFSPRIQSRI